jgi:deazaflavin-dependent oxidoreductase (nitroreductase family)
MALNPQAPDEAVRAALARNGVIDITTTGRRSGQPRRIEIAYHVIGGQIYISGLPSRRTRDWLHNLRANPALTVHVKRGAQADLPATARVIDDPAERREVLNQVARNWRRDDVDVMVEHSPLIEVTIPGYTPTYDATAA